MKNREDITVITDPGVDDIVALILLEKLASRQNKLLITTYGNNELSITDSNGRKFVASRGRDWQYRPGTALPLNKEIERPWAENYHGADGLWGVQLPTLDNLKPVSRVSTPDVISLGPLTEAYKLMQQTTLEKLTIMGGAFSVAGNETKNTEFNIAMDADAARLLFTSCQDIRVQVVPMDATSLVRWSLSDISRIPEINATNRWLKQMLLAWFDSYKLSKEKQFVLYDPLAVYLRFYPEAAQWMRSGITVVSRGIDRGRTILSATNPPCEIAIGVYKPEQISSRIFSLVFEESGNA